MSIFNIDLTTCTADNYRAVYNYLKSKQQTPDELFSPLSVKELQFLTPVYGVMPEIPKVFNAIKISEEREAIIKDYPAQSTIKKAIFLTPDVFELAYLTPWAQNGAFDKAPTPPQPDRVALLPFYFEFEDGQTLVIFFDTVTDKGLAVIDPWTGKRIYPNPVTRLKISRCFLNHIEITDILGKYETKEDDFFWNLKRCSLLVQLNSENAKRWQQANKEGLSEMWVQWNKFSGLKDRTDGYPFIHNELMASRLKSFTPDRFSAMTMATQIQIGLQKYYEELARRRQESRDAEEDRKKIKEFEEYQIRRQAVKDIIDEYRAFDTECYNTYQRQLKVKRAELGVFLNQNGVVGSVDKINYLPPITKPHLKVLEEPQSWKDFS